MKAHLAIAIAAAAACTGAAAAASFGVGTGGLAGGQATVSRCDTNGLTVTYATTGPNVTSVTVADLADPGCEGATLRVAVTNLAGVSIGAGGPQTVATDGDTDPNSATVNVSPPAAETNLSRIMISLVGP